MEVPETLYKYRRCDKYNEDILLSNEMFLPRPSTFNDPFDCRIPIMFDGTKDEWRDFLRPRLREAHPEWADNLLDAEVELMINSGVQERMQSREFAEFYAERELEKMEVLCLSRPRDDILMWSHYADEHRGVCFGFATQKWVLLRNKVKPVVYQDTYPEVNALKVTTQDAIHSIAFTKFSHWAHEEEWRVVRRATPNQRYRFPPDALVEVIFGARIDHRDMRRLIVMAHRSKCELKFFKALPRAGHFQLEIIECEITEEMLREALGETEE